MSRSLSARSPSPPIRLGRFAYVAIYLAFSAVVARTLAIESIRPRLPLYMALELLFLLLYTAVFIFPLLSAWLVHLYFALQSVIILCLLSLRPEFDFLILLYLLLSVQVPLVLTGRLLWGWVGLFVLLSAGSLIYFDGLARGLALSLTTIAGELVVPVYIIVYHENEIARGRSQTLLSELQETNNRLQLYTSQVEDLTALQERNRLARELHDTVSQLVFSISLNARSAQVLLETDPQRLPAQLARLQEMTAEALAQLRSLISRLRPPETS
jgi:signal transduction histidine kinase